ncbi:MAG: helix-turn-helix transcriptional regulator [Clostridiales bacterium]|nr:helix-turn-helix transcriptional regulator [Clostridiales bacterium]
MDIKEILTRIGYVRNQANLSARELSLRIGMSQQYIGKIEGGHIVLTVEKLLQILEICNFSLDRFFSKNIYDYNEDKELENLLSTLPLEKKKHIIEFIKR